MTRQLRPRRSRRTTGLVLACAVVAASPGAAGPGSGSTPGSPERQASAAGDRNAGRPIVTRADLEAATPWSANPYLSYLAEGVEPDWEYWAAKVHFDSQDNAAADPRPRTRGATFAETEDNDSYGTANALPPLVAGGPPLQVTGTTDQVPTFHPPQDAGESGACSNDSSATATSITHFIDGVRTPVQGAIGDCASGVADLDNYRVFLSEGDTLTVDVDSAGISGLYVYIFGDSPYNVLDVSGRDPYDPSDFDPYASASIPVSGQYRVLIGSLSGTGSYTAYFGRNPGHDVFSLELEEGDVVGVSSDLVAELSLVGPDLLDRFGSGRALNDLYPAGSPLPTTATGAEVSSVVGQSGTHYLRLRTVEQFATPYTLQVQVFRPGTEGPTRQRLFVDFDGATIDADALFDSGPEFVNATLSPLSSFLSAWGLSAGDQDAVISEVLAVVAENLDDLAAVHPSFTYELTNSRDDPDPFGEPGVSRVIVGGTREQLGRETIGVASAIDPGNYGLEDTAVVLLDLLSGPSESQSSLNRFTLAPGATKVELVGTGVGNIASHEIGHFLGAWHTEVSNSIYALVDRGGDLAKMLGSNDDTFGDADDRDVDFLEDIYAGGSLIRGVEDQAARVSYAMTSRTAIFADGFESGDVSAWQ